MLHQLRHLKQVALKKSYICFFGGRWSNFCNTACWDAFQTYKDDVFRRVYLSYWQREGDQILQKDIVAVIAVLSVCTLGNDDTCEVS